MTKDQQTTATVLAKQLAEHIAECDIDQYRVLMASRKGNKRSVVLVALSDTAVDRLLDWIDSQKESGRMVDQILQPTFSDSPRPKPYGDLG